MGRLPVMLVLAAGVCLGLVRIPASPALVGEAYAAEGDMAALQERFRKRYPALLKEIRAGRIGEMADGFVAAVKPADVQGEANVSRRTLIAAENADRRELYALLAEQQKVSADLVAQRNAQRKFKEAAPGDYLKPAGGGWITKAEWDKSQQGK